MEETKILFEFDKNLWAYGSPIVFKEGVLEEGENSNTVSFTIVNIFDEAINEINLTLVNKGDEEKETTYVYKDLNMVFLDEKGSDVKIKVDKDIVDFDIKLGDVVFANGAVWKNEEATFESIGEIEDFDVFARAKAKDYYDNYTTAVENIEKGDSINMTNGIEILKRIPWYKDAAKLVSDNEKKIEVIKKQEERVERIREKKDDRKQAIRKKYVKAAIALIIVGILAAVGTVAFVIPNNQYKDAKKLLKAKKYTEASKKLEKLNGFLSSEDELAESYYNIAKTYMDNGDDANARTYFDKAVECAKDSTYGKMAQVYVDYFEGYEALEAGNIEEAKARLTACSKTQTEFELVNKVSAGLAEVSYMEKDYLTAWNTINNVFKQDPSYEQEYGTYGYAYAKSLVASGKIKEGIQIYNTISKYTKSKNLTTSVYDQAVKLGEKGKITEAMKVLSSIKGSSKKANSLYKEMKEFNYKVRFWVGTWRHRGIVKGEKATYKIYISEVLYKGDMCLRIKDQNNKYLGFDTVLSAKNRVRNLEVGTYQLNFKLKKYHNQKFLYILKGGRKMVRQLKFEGETYKTTYKKVK